MQQIQTQVRLASALLVCTHVCGASAAQQLDHVDGGSGQRSTTVLDDAVPLPDPPVYARSPEGDRAVQPATGNPYFLGFCAGAYFPPEGERIDPLLVSRLQSLYDDGRPSNETYAYVIFSKRITPERMAELADLGARVLGTHPYYAVKVALAPQTVDVVAALPFVRWIGLPRDAQKVHPHLTPALDAAQDGELVDVFVNVYDSDLNPSSTPTPSGTLQSGEPGGIDGLAAPSPFAPTSWQSNGWQQRALEGLGLEVRECFDGRTFRARMAPASLEALVQSDFVQFVESDGPAQLAHDESMPMLNVDSSRASWSGGTSSTALVGICDSGYDSGHDALNDNWRIGWDLTGSGTAFQDGCAHGSHVAGTLLGSGDVSASLKGVAPGLGWSSTGRVMVARIFNNACAFSGTTSQALMAGYGVPWVTGTDSTPKAHVINHSWGRCTPNACPPASAGPWSTWWGSEDEPRWIDDGIYNNKQLHIYCAGNEGNNPVPGNGTIRMQGTAKNALTVGSVMDYDSNPGPAAPEPGDLTPSSSRGPCMDGRWKPNVVAPGEFVYSAQAGTANGYVNYSGTSMATPHVTGLAAQLCDHYSWLRYEPARLAAHLMATALTKNDQLLTTPDDAHLDQYGAGRVEAYKAHWALAGQFAATSWGFDQGAGDPTSVADFVVPAGTTRLVVCMVYHEPGQSPGGTPALINNFDLYIDSPPIDPGNNTGDYLAQQSPRDNVEIRIIDNPPAGTWRWKTFPTNVTGAAHVAISVCTIGGDTTPDGTLSLTPSNNCIRPNVNVNLVATVTNPSYIASAVFLDSTSTGDALQVSTTTLEDGAVTNLMIGGNRHGGRDLMLGDITAGRQRSALWTTRWATEGVKQFTVQARSDNWVNETKSVNITVDGTGPGAATNVGSATHTLGVWKNDANITFQWSPAVDNLSGLFGYGVLTAASATMPPQAINITNPLAQNWNETLATGAWHFNIRALDNCGNWSTSYGTAGPFLIDTIAPTDPSGLASPSHALGVQSCDTFVTVDWSSSTDAHSGLAGYAGLWNYSPNTELTGPGNIGPNATTYTLNIGSSPQPRYFHLRAIDVAGNRSATVHFGPVIADANTMSTYCTAKTNSLGCVPAIAWLNQPSQSAGDFEVRCSNVLNNKNGLLYWGFQPSSAPFQGGIKCVAAPTQRTPVQSSNGSASGNNCSGLYRYTFTTSYMSQQGLDPGTTAYAQWWMRDPQSPSTTGLSAGLEFTVCE